MIALFKRLFPGRGRSAKAPAIPLAPIEETSADRPQPKAFDPAPPAVSLAYGSDPAIVADLDDAGEDRAELEDEDLDDRDDPTVGRLEPLQISAPDAGAVSTAREAAERLALSGPQRITPNDPAGPGSLAETLTRMEAQGLVQSRVVEDDESGLYLVFEPIRETHPRPSSLP